MHTSYLPTGQRSRFKEAIQMQISSDIKPQEAAKQPVLLFVLYKVSEFVLFIYIFIYFTYLGFAFKRRSLFVYSH